jgi:hypothetical protein
MSMQGNKVNWRDGPNCAAGKESPEIDQFEFVAQLSMIC